MKLIFISSLLPSLARGAYDLLRHDEEEDTSLQLERILEKVERLEQEFENLRSQLATHHRRLSDNCLAEIPVNGTACVFDQDIMFAGPVQFYNETVFNEFTVFEDSVTLTGEEVVVSSDTSVEFLGDVEFKGDSEFPVTFESEVNFVDGVLFEDDVEFEEDALFLGNVIIEGPGARRTRRRMSGGRKLDSSSSSSDDDGTSFEILGRVDIDLESDNDLIIESETYFEEDVHVGENDRRRLKRNSNRDKPRLFVEGEMDVESDLIVKGLLEVDDDTVFHGDLVYEEAACLVDCSMEDHDHC